MWTCSGRLAWSSGVGNFQKRRPGFLWKLSPDLIIGNRLQAVRYNFASQIESSRRRRKNLAHTIRVSNWPRLCRCFVCCKALVGMNSRCKRWFASILGSRLGKSIWLHYFVFCRQVNNAIGFPCPCVTVHEANEWKKKKCGKHHQRPKHSMLIRLSMPQVPVWESGFTCCVPDNTFLSNCGQVWLLCEKTLSSFAVRGIFFFCVGPVLRRTVLVFVRWCFCLFVLCFVCC